MSELIDYPPFYTLQPNLDVRSTQLSNWRTVLMASKEWTLDISSSVFVNKKIDRAVSAELFKAIGDSLKSSGSAMWLSEKKFILLRVSLEKYADEVMRWVDYNGASNTVETIFNIGNSSEGFSFKGAPDELILAALSILETRGKCKIMRSKGNDSVEHIGVKFLH